MTVTKTILRGIFALLLVFAGGYLISFVFENLFVSLGLPSLASLFISVPLAMAWGWFMGGFMGSWVTKDIKRY